MFFLFFFFFVQAEDGIRDLYVTGVQTCALPISMSAMTRGWNRDHVASIVRDTLTDVIEPIIYAEALELFDEHHAAGRKVVIVSSAPMEVVQPLSEFLGADEVIGTRAAVDADGNYTGELEFYAYGAHKAQAVRLLAAREHINLARSEERRV